MTASGLTTRQAAQDRRTPRRVRERGRWLTTAIGVLLTALMLFPVYWMVSTAFKPGSDIFANTPVWFPYHPTLTNFGDAIHRPHFWADVKNSLIIVSVVVAMSLVLAFLAALALAKFRFYGRRAFIILIIAVQMIPLNALIIPIYLVLSKAHSPQLGCSSRAAVATLLPQRPTLLPRYPQGPSLCLGSRSLRGFRRLRAETRR